ncbi:MAG: TRAM domain-containing protein [Chloroflexota bacterium]
MPGICLTTDVIVGFCGETDAQYEEPLDLIRTVRFDGVFAAAFSPRPGTPAARLADDVPADVKRRRLNTLLDLQEGIGLERNQAWVGRRTEVLVDEVRPPRSHDHGAARAAAPRVAGRNREGKLVHLDGGPDLVGRLVEVVVDHAGPYALTGRLAGTP